MLLLIAYIGFVSLGLPDTMVGVAWPAVRQEFHLHQDSIALVFSGAGCGYFFSSFFTGRLLRVIGIGTLLTASTAIVALSGYGFGLSQLWLLFAACSVLHGLGSGAIDAGLNHYVAHHFSPRHMNWLHACYGLGATLGPLIMTGAITSLGSWRTGYFILATTLLLLSFVFAATRSQWNRPTSDGEGGQESKSAGIFETLGHATVWLHITFFFFYTGLEVTVGQWSFTLLTESRGISNETAGLGVASYWGGISVGRVLFGFIVERIGIDKMIRWSLLTASLGTTLLALNISETVTLLSLVLAGAGLAAIYPCMMSRTPQRLGSSLSAHAIGFQVSAAMLGAAALPSLSGVLAQRAGLESITAAAVAMAFFLMLLHEMLLSRDAKR
jgi:fucose permease